MNCDFSISICYQLRERKKEIKRERERGMLSLFTVELKHHLKLKHTLDKVEGKPGEIEFRTSLALSIRD